LLQGVALMSGSAIAWKLNVMPRFLLEHAHSALECGVVFASFKAFDSPLRHVLTMGSCDFGSHRIWWDVEATTAAEALANLPRYVAERTTATRVRDMQMP
jgi:hypothetical protein